MVLDRETLDLAPVAPRVLEAAGPTAPFKLEAPAAQVEVVTPPADDVPSAIATLARGRRTLVEACRTLDLVPVCVAVHPFAAAEGKLNRGERYDRVAKSYGVAALRQQIAALQVHVRVSGADRALAVYNALRGYLPELAALAAHAPFYEGRDSGFASVRPAICEMLPRQGVPPALESWEALAEGLAWAGDEGAWWWELRPHRAHGTLEIRVPDAQASLADAEAIASVSHALTAYLAARYDAGERLPVHSSWRIAENRRSAARMGVAGTMLDLDTGAEEQTSDRLHSLLATITPFASQIGASRGIASAHEIIAAGGGAGRLRAVAAERGMHGAVSWLCERYLDTSGMSAEAAIASRGDLGIAAELAERSQRFARTSARIPRVDALDARPW